MHKSAIIIAAAALAAAGASPALARQSTTAMSCSQAQKLVRSSGAIVLSTGRHTYARFVANGNYCAAAEYPVWTYARTRDSRRCLVGFVCSANVTVDDGMSN